MEWKDLAPIIGASAPTLGRLLGGLLPLPFGGSIGQAIGSTIAAAIGAPDATPDSIAQTIQSTPSDVVAAQLAEAEKAAAAFYKAQGDVGVAEVQSTAKSYQSELLEGNLFQKSWRPLAMYVWIASWPIQLGAILWHLATKDPATISQLSGMVTALTAWNAGPASLAGIYSWGRTREKMAADGNGH